MDKEEESRGTTRQEQEEALIALIEHRTREVDHIKTRISYYQKQLEEAEKKLNDSESQLARLGAQRIVPQSKPSHGSGTKSIKVIPAVHSNEVPSKSQPQIKTELVIPSLNPNAFKPKLSSKSGSRASVAPVTQSSPPSARPSGTPACQSSTPLRNSDATPKIKVEKVYRSSPDAVEVEERGAKRKLSVKESKQHKELINSIGRSSSPSTINCYASNHISSQHRRKLRSLVLCPVNDQLFATSALDGLVNLWQIQSKGSSASLLSSTDCLSSKERRWPEDLAWHPTGNSLFCTYTADGGDSQISILNLNKTQGRARITFLEDKPHVKGIINSISFMPWDGACFASGGSDHAVVLWNEKGAENLWKPKALHRNLHSSSVMGVAGLEQKHIVLSAGADRRVVGFDVQAGRADFKHQLDSKCMSIVPNPSDFNLFMVQTGIPQKQLRLFDIRIRQTELHCFGFKQESSDSQSALINQAWSPDGWYLTSGSVDPVIHIFDIRYNSNKPSQSIKAHNKRVFKAVWHFTFPLLISISSDLHIGLHKIV